MNAITNLSYPVGDMNEWQIVATKKILGLKSLGTNWDSYGSPPVTNLAVNSALHLVKYAGIGNSPTPRVIPVSGGGIQLEWESGARELEIEIQANGVIMYLPVHDGEPAEICDLDPRAFTREVKQLLSWLVSG